MKSILSVMNYAEFALTRYRNALGKFVLIHEYLLRVVGMGIQHPHSLFD